MVDKILFARDLETLDRLKQAFVKNNDKEIGFILGYPESAINAYIEGKKFDEADYKNLPAKEKEKLKKGEILNFINFGLSKNNWQEELKIIQEYQKLIRQKSPNIYKEILTRSKKNQHPLTEESKVSVSQDVDIDKL